MSGDVSDRKRLISLTGGNLHNNNIYFSGHLDFFPKKCFGQSNKKLGVGEEVSLFNQMYNIKVGFLIFHWAI
jgi:hypothetical protein